MKCKNWSNKINNFVVRKLKSFKINGQQKVTSTTTMPTMPKEIKKSTLSINENKFNDYDDNNIIKMKQQHHNNHQDQQKLQFKQKSTSIIHSSKKHSIETSKKSSSLSQTKITPAIEATAQSFMMITDDKNYDENNDKKNNTSSTSSTTTTSTFLNENLLAKLSLTVQDIYDDLKSSEASNNTLTANKMSVDDFIFGRNCGEGSFSTVYHAKDIHTNKEYAIKVCDKQHILRERKQEYVRREREAMQIMQNTPGFVNLSGTFQDYQNLYFIMTYAKNGDLLPYIQKVGSFDLDCARYYSAELLISIEQMHKKGIIHRDLKPENILLDKDMHTLITDFGSVKILGSDRNNSCSMSEINPNRRRRCSFVGTAQYVSPEVLLGQDVTRAADLWALGCIIYQMLTGLYPFRGDNEYLIFKEILNLNLEFPDGFDRDAADLIRSLLKLNPEERIGFQDKIGRYESIRTHPFFDEINWDVVRKQTPPQICSCVVDLHKHDDDDDCNDDAILCSR